jgi:pimeloyl-ACP methyl ester carboxylesterase
MSATISKAYADLPWGQLHFRTVAGAASGPLMVLLHQSPLSSRNYERLLPLLAGCCRPCALDTPGYGGSSAVPEEWEVKDYANAVWDFADRMGAEKIVRRSFCSAARRVPCSPWKPRSPGRNACIA